MPVSGQMRGFGRFGAGAVSRLYSLESSRRNAGAALRMNLAVSGARVSRPENVVPRGVREGLLNLECSTTSIRSWNRFEIHSESPTAYGARLSQYHGSNS